MSILFVADSARAGGARRQDLVANSSGAGWELALSLFGPGGGHRNTEQIYKIEIKRRKRQ